MSTVLTYDVHTILRYHRASSPDSHYRIVQLDTTTAWLRTAETPAPFNDPLASFSYPLNELTCDQWQPCHFALLLQV